MLFDGVLLSNKLKEEFIKRIEEFTKSYGRSPCLGVLKATNDRGAESYLKRKKKVFSSCNAQLKVIDLSENVTYEEYRVNLEKMNDDNTIDAILIETPLPKCISFDKVTSLIDPDKDAEGITDYNIAGLFRGEESIVPSTPNAVMKILAEHNIETAGKRVVIVGRSEIVTKPLAMLLLRKGKFGDATITVCHSKTKDMKSILKEADIIISASGCPKLINGDELEKKPILIDVGTGSIPCVSAKSGYRICGDIHLSSPQDYPSFFTPVPGGVGPITGIMILENVIKIAERRNRS